MKRFRESKANLRNRDIRNSGRASCCRLRVVESAAAVLTNLFTRAPPEAILASGCVNALASVVLHGLEPRIVSSAVRALSDIMAAAPSAAIAAAVEATGFLQPLAARLSSQLVAVLALPSSACLGALSVQRLAAY